METFNQSVNNMLRFLTKKDPSMATLRSNRGFTLIEMVITVAVLGILVSTSLPSIFDFMRQQDNQKEEIALQEIRKAIEGYLAANGTVPDDNDATLPWSKALAGYTNLSEKEIDTDTWNRPRMYVMYKNTTRKAFGNKVPVYYITVFSKGSNGMAENEYVNDAGGKTTIPGIAIVKTVVDSITQSEYAGVTNTNWWKNNSMGVTADEKAAAKVDSFAGIRSGGDDHLMRFTNYTNALERYNETVKRLDAVTQALETYARSGYAAKVSECSNNPTPPAECTDGTLEKKVYYPYGTAANNSYAESQANVNLIYNSTTLVVNNNGNTETRRTGMQSLMNILGLPVEYCCSAIDNTPFYYFSNPRPRSDTGTPPCAARPTLNSTKLPARILTTDSYNEAVCG